MADCGHSDRPAAARCVSCGMTLCDSCRRLVDGRNYCSACRPGKKPRRPKSPVLALVLSLAPGLGHLYGGAWLRGLLFLGGIPFCLARCDVIPLPVTIFLLFFCAWDARRAVLKRNAKAAAAAGGPRRRDGAKRRERKPRRRAAGDGDWMLWAGTALLTFLFFFVPAVTGKALEPPVIWAGFGTAVVAALIMGGRGAQAREKSGAAPGAAKGGSDE